MGASTAKVKVRVGDHLDLREGAAVRTWSPAPLTSLGDTGWAAVAHTPTDPEICGCSYLPEFIAYYEDWQATIIYHTLW